MQEQNRNIKQRPLIHLGEDRIAMDPIENQQDDSFQAILASNYCEQDIEGKIFAYFLFISLLIVHITLIQQSLSSQAFHKKMNSVIFLFENNSIVAELLISSLILIKATLLLPIIARFVRQDSYWIRWIIRRSMNAYVLLSELDLVLSAFMVFTSWKQSLCFLSLTVFTQIFQAIYMQNYIIRKDAFYASSAFHYIFFRLLILLSYLGNIVFFALGDERNFHIFHCCLGLMHMIWCLKSGCMLFIHRLTKNIFILFNGLLITVNYGLAEKLILEHDFLNEEQICKYLILFPSTMIYLYLKSIPSLQKLSRQNLKNPKITDLLIKTLLQSPIDAQDAELELIGFLYLQYKVTDESQLHSLTDLYDPSLKTWIKSDQIYVQKQTAIFSYIKRLYSRSIQLHSTPYKSIDFCQFLCNEYNNPYLAIKYLERAKLSSLNTIQAIKVRNIEYHIASKWKSFNNELYNGKLQIQSFFQASNIIENIGRIIRKFIKENLSLWNLIKSRQLKPSQLRNIMKQQLSSLLNLQKEWREVFKFLSMNKRWLLIYNLYTLFIKNVKTSQKLIDLANNQIEKPFSYDISHTHRFVDAEKEKEYCSSAFMSSQDSCYLTASIQSGKTKINKINRIFMEITGYKQAEIIGSHVQVLMDDELAKVHQEKVDSWLYSGRISNEQQYRIPFTSFVGKDGIAIPALKYYKAYYQIEKGVEFVCLLKANTKKAIDAYNNSLAKLSLQKNQLNSAYINIEKLQRQQVKDVLFHDQQESNIFIKEYLLQPNKSLSQIRSFKLFSRLSITMIILAIISFSVIVRSDSADLNSYCNQFFTFMSMYRFPVGLGINYLKKFLNIGNMAKNHAQIQTATNGMMTDSAASQIKLTIFDPNLNPEAIYYPDYNYSFLANNSKNNIDLFYTILNDVSSMNQPSINRKSPQFLRFYSYLKPAYDNMMNTTKYRLQQTFTQIFSQSVNKQISLIVVQFVLPIVFLAIALCILKAFAQKIANALSIPLQFGPNYIQTIETYWKNNQKYFTPLLSQTSKESQIFNQKSVLVTLVKSNIRSKQDSFDFPASFMNNQKLNPQLGSKISIAIVALAIIVLCGATKFNIWAKFHNLKQLQDEGFFFLRYFPCASLVAMGCVQKYYSLQYPQQITFNPKKYDDALGASYILGYKYDYINQIEDPSSLYYAKQKNYFHGSACEYNHAVLIAVNITAQKCLSISNGSFKQGIAGFLRYTYNLGLAYMNNQTTLTVAQIDELTLGTLVLSSYILDAMLTWSSEFASKIEEIRASSLTICLSLIGTVLALHLIVNEWKVVKSAEAQYSLIKNMYANLVPQFILTEDKVVRQKFVNQGILSP